MSDSDDKRGYFAPFVDKLWGLLDKDDRGTLAQMRRLDDDRAAAALAGPIGRLLPYNLSRHDEDVCLSVARLFALLRAGARQGGADFGEVLGRFAGELGEDRSKGLERRVSGLLAADAEELPDHLSRMAGLLSGSRAVQTLDWERLIKDLRNWSSPKGEVQRRWAHSFIKARHNAVPGADGEPGQDDPNAEGLESTASA